MPHLPQQGIQLANNVTELTAIAPLIPGGAEILRQIFQAKKKDEEKGNPGPLNIIETIHYARWVILDGGTRLLFTSNYDGNLEDYLAEFAERDEVPLNTIFSQCVGWPGARPLGPFIEYVKEHIVQAEYYYSAYPRHTVKEIKRALYWKKETEAFIHSHLEAMSEFARELKEYCVVNQAARDALGKSQYVNSVEGLEKARNDIRAFLKRLAAPTQETDKGLKGNEA
ncbi:MAG: hypothetical protein P0119_09840 [Nitrospira sp.]|nr:hypothetical protein [Nitrospira sp.]